MQPTLLLLDYDALWPLRQDRCSLNVRTAYRSLQSVRWGERHAIRGVRVKGIHSVNVTAKLNYRASRACLPNRLRDAADKFDRVDRGVLIRGCALVKSGHNDAPWQERTVKPDRSQIKISDIGLRGLRTEPRSSKVRDGGVGTTLQFNVRETAGRENGRESGCSTCAICPNPIHVIVGDIGSSRLATAHAAAVDNVVKHQLVTKCGPITAG